MAGETHTGSRIRERRIMAGHKQAELAQLVGISASYLNLIEHNRRRIGGKLLLKIAQVLEVNPQLLTEGAEAALIAMLKEAAAATDLPSGEAARAEEFAGRFPAWAKVLARAQRRITELEERIEGLTNRLEDDPHLAASIHELLTTAAAVRSTASILVQNETLEPQWRNRFHANIDVESRRLAENAQALAGYLEAAGSAQKAQVHPLEEAEAFLTRHDLRFAVLEEPGGIEAVPSLIEAAPDLRSKAAREIAGTALRQLSADAAHLPADDLATAFADTGFDPARLAALLGQPAARVLRRLAAHPGLNAGLVVTDAMGGVLYRKAIGARKLPQWPVFAALGRPGLLVSERLTDPEDGAALHVLATCDVAPATAYNVAPTSQVVMLILSGDDAALKPLTDPRV
ncbi:MAG: helix-turn-helix domain-containing protein [Pseudomonadota bacterium]